MNIEELAMLCHKASIEKGWWKDYSVNGDKYNGSCDLSEVNNIAAKILLIHSELSEGTEEVRKNLLNIYYEGNGDTLPKPEGLLIELADAVIRIFDLSEALYNQGLVKNLISEAIRIKMEYNKTRPHRHGGKSL